MPKRMIIDASHREETRVVVLDGQQKLDESALVVGLKSTLVSGTVSAEVDRYGSLKLTVTSKCLRSQYPPL